MMQISIGSLVEGDVVITPNLRSARVWSRAAHACAEGRALPLIVATAVWLQSLWEALRLSAPLPVLLSPGQERALWQRVIARSTATPGVFSNDAMVAEAARAWRLATTWSCPEPLLNGDDALDVQTFYNWQRAFRAALQKNSWITQAELTHALAEQLAPERPWPVHVVCKRVVTLPTVQDDPALAKLLAVFRTRGIAHAELAWRDAPTAPECKVFSMASDEWRAAAEWAKAQVAAHSQAQVVIVVPQLHAVRHAVKRVMRDVLVPEQWGDPRADNGSKFNLSLGVRLSDVPLVASALEWLAWARAPQPLARVRVALAAPFVPPAQFWVKKAIEMGFTQLSMGSFTRRAAATHPVHAFAANTATWPANRLPSQWSEHLHEALVSIGFPGAGLDSENAQAAVALFELIDGLYELDEVLGACSVDAVLAELRERCVTHDFQAEGKDAPIQVLGLYESLGIACDAMWITGATDDALPEPSEISPMLPRVWQRTVPVGRATPEVMRDAAARMWAQWERAAPELVLSISAGKPESPVRPASFIAHGRWEPVTARDEPVSDLAPMQSLPDSFGVSFDDVQLPGGASLLQQQAQCAFQAYAAFRLRASVFPSAEFGLTAQVRGVAVHAALAALWREVGSHAHWALAEPDVQDRWVGDAVASAMEPVEKECKRRDLPDWLARLFETQLRALIFEWMTARELPRAPFQVIHTEIKAPLQIAGRQLDLRIDRVDELSDGSLLVIDYKTGQVPATAPIAEPDVASLHPQLPAYALALSSDVKSVSGLAYARVVREKHALRGLARVAGEGGSSNTWLDIPSARDKAQTQFQPEAWAHIQTGWSQAIEKVVQAYAAGDATVAPAHSAVCRNCERQALCRVKVKATPLSEDDDAALDA